MSDSHNVRGKFVGSWKLISVSVKNAGHFIHPFGRHVKGLLIYTSKHMSVQIMMPVHFPISHERKLSIKLEELANTLKTTGYMGYWGTWHVKTESHTIIHKVGGAIAQPIVHGNEIRKYKFFDQMLALSSGPLELLWERLE